MCYSTNPRNYEICKIYDILNLKQANLKYQNILGYSIEHEGTHGNTKVVIWSNIKDDINGWDIYSDVVRLGTISSFNMKNSTKRNNL